MSDCRQGGRATYDRPENRTEIRVCFTDADEIEYFLPIALLDRHISHFEVDGVKYCRVDEREDE